MGSLADHHSATCRGSAQKGALQASQEEWAIFAQIFAAHRRFPLIRFTASSRSSARAQWQSSGIVVASMLLIFTQRNELFRMRGRLLIVGGGLQCTLAKGAPSHSVVSTGCNQRNTVKVATYNCAIFINSSLLGVVASTSPCPSPSEPLAAMSESILCLRRARSPPSLIHG